MLSLCGVEGGDDAAAGVQETLRPSPPKRARPTYELNLETALAATSHKQADDDRR
jgi:hypothetical protein